MPHYIIGLDVGGTKIAAGTVDARCGIVKKIAIPTEASRGKRIILKNILAAASKVWLPGVKAIGVAMAGQCDSRHGIFVGGPNFPKNFKHVAVAKILEKSFHVPVALDNDAHAFTLAESIYGAGRQYKNIIGLTVGTGIGGGIIIDKKILRGKNNTAGEVGHITIDASSPFRCGCGRTGHFEALASGTALENFYKKLTGKKINALEIEKRYLKGDKNAKKAAALTAKYLGLGLASIINLLDPDIVIMGGGLSRFRALWPLALQTLKKEVIYKALQNTPVVKSKLGNDAGIIGAAMLADI